MSSDPRPMRIRERNGYSHFPSAGTIQSQPHGQGIGWHKPIVIPVLLRRRGIIDARRFSHPDWETTFSNGWPAAVSSANSVTRRVPTVGSSQEAFTSGRRSYRVSGRA